MSERSVMSKINKAELSPPMPSATSIPATYICPDLGRHQARIFHTFYPDADARLIRTSGMDFFVLRRDSRIVGENSLAEPVAANEFPNS